MEGVVIYMRRVCTGVQEVFYFLCIQNIVAEVDLYPFFVGIVFVESETEEEAIHV